ncbi:LysR family transcriptional regulator [Stappia sp.]|uniref:LysR family transcriptional regulator n=1 Tax=Stappia sp. TaxID=1870903 RepID=UPI003A9A0EEB
MLNSVWLKTFVALCDAGHFTRAAHALNITQPGVSQHVKKLEEQVGEPLVSRDGKSFMLTPAGEMVLDFARRRQVEEKRLLSDLQQDDPDAGQVSVACSGSLALLLYPHFMEMMAAAPALAIRLEATPQSRVLAGASDGTVDLGIVDHAPTHARLEGERVGQDELCLVVPKARGAVATLAELEDLGFIAHPDGFAYADELLGANFAEDYQGADRLRQRSFINQISQIPEPVVRGLGYTILPRSGIDLHARREQLTVCPLAHPVRHELWLIRRKGRVLPARTRRVREVIGDVLAALEARHLPGGG